MKRLLVLLVAFVYLVPVSFVIISKASAQEQIPSSFASGLLMLPMILIFIVMILGVANVIGAVVSAVRLKHLSFKVILIFKLCLIPFYIINFIIWCIGSMVFHISFIVWPMLPFIIAYTYSTMIATSAYIMAKLLIMHGNRQITTKQFMIHCFFQAMFVTDVIDSAYLAIKQKAWEGIREQ